MPFPSEEVIANNMQDRLIMEELNFDREVLCNELTEYFQSMTNEQRRAYDEIMNAIDGNKGSFYFLYGYGGIGKTFLSKTLSASIRSKGEIVLNVASSRIASLILPNGRIAHSRFKIPLNINEDSTCNIKQGSSHARLLSKAKLIIWDEAPMLSKYCYEALDRCLNDVLRFVPNYNGDLPFGGKVVVLGGDFRQILPMIPRETREDIVQASINLSYLRSFCKVIKLTKNMRLRISSTSEDNNELIKFSEWLLQIGDGIAGNSTEGKSEVQIPGDILIKNSDIAFDELCNIPKFAIRINCAVN